MTLGIKTSIGWADSSCNGQEGCDGCELWKPGQGGTCYAGGMIRRWKNSIGHPDAFELPEIYPYRIVDACAWPDLTGTKRAGKPWLDGRPRLIFFDDMGDTYTEKLDDPAYVRGLYDKARSTALGPSGLKKHLPLFLCAVEAVENGGHWLDPFIGIMRRAPCIWLMLTKRPKRMRRAFDHVGGIPPNFWPMTSVTSRGTLARVHDLLAIPDATVYGCSYEPARPGVDFTGLMSMAGGAGLSWLIFGGGSGAGEQVCEVSALRSALATARDAGAAPFMKQAGRRCRMSTADAGRARRAGAKITRDGDRVVVTFNHSKGEDLAELPVDLAFETRQVPQTGAV